jgi:hypothetical protein
MAITAIITQPGADILKPCMRPIILEAQTVLTTPMVFCDVYINNEYFGSYEHTTWNQKVSGVLIWQFDIRDKVQEYFQNIKPQTNGQNTIQQGGSSCRVFCKFRDSTYQNNIVVAETPLPVQGNRVHPPQPGGGVASNTFYVMYATLQHESNQDFETHLRSFQRLGWRSDAYPLSHRPKDGYNVVPGYADVFPFAVKQPTVWGIIRLRYRRTLAVIWQSLDYNVPPPPPQCFAIITGTNFTINLDHSVDVSATMTGATELVWSIPDASMSGTVLGNNIHVAPLSIGTHPMTIWPRCSNGVNGNPVTIQIVVTARPTAWRGRASDAFCEHDSNGDNTGRIVYQTLEQIYTDVTPNALTGNTKPNIVSDADYVPPVYNTTACPLPNPGGSGRAISVKYSTDMSTICATTAQTVYISPLYTDVQTGITIYSDSALTLPLQTYQFITTTFGAIYDINPATGIVGASTGQIC